MADVEFAGERFEVADTIGLMPLMKFAKVAKGGTDSSDLDGLSALYDLLEQCIAPAEWDRFTDVATKKRADGDALMAVVGKVFEALSGRPTLRPSDSSDGPTSTPQNSGDASYLRVVKRLESEGRPDTALIVQMANETRSVASAS